MNCNWRIIADTVTGHSHIRKNRPNQDNGGWFRGTAGYPLIGVVSDGHGGQDYFRSDRGSAFAVQVTIRVLSNLIQSDTKSISPHSIDQICKEIIREWKNAVFADIQRYPYSRTEYAIIEESRAGKKFNTPIDPDYFHIRPYGSTLLTTVVTEKAVFFFQLGDGDIVIHSPEGAFFRPIPPDEFLSGNETYSLCLPESWRDFKVNQIGFIPDFIMLSTDGYVNSFQEEEGFFTAASDYYSYFIKAENFQSGVQIVQSNLNSWLSNTSKKGSGDDITLIIFTHDMLIGNTNGQTESPQESSLLIPLSVTPQSYEFLQSEDANQTSDLILDKPEELLKQKSDDCPINTEENRESSQVEVSVQPKKRLFSKQALFFSVICGLIFLIIGVFLFQSTYQQSPAIISPLNLTNTTPNISDYGIINSSQISSTDFKNSSLSRDTSTFPPLVTPNDSDQITMNSSDPSFRGINTTSPTKAIYPGNNDTNSKISVLGNNSTLIDGVEHGSL